MPINRNSVRVVKNRPPNDKLTAALISERDQRYHRRRQVDTAGAVGPRTPAPNDAQQHRTQSSSSEPPSTIADRYYPTPDGDGGASVLRPSQPSTPVRQLQHANDADPSIFASQPRAEFPTIDAAAGGFGPQHSGTPVRQSAFGVDALHVRPHALCATSAFEESRPSAPATWTHGADALAPGHDIARGMRTAMSSTAHNEDAEQRACADSAPSGPPRLPAHSHYPWEIPPTLSKDVGVYLQPDQSNGSIASNSFASVVFASDAAREIAAATPRGQPFTTVVTQHQPTLAEHQPRPSTHVGAHHQPGQSRTSTTSFTKVSFGSEAAREVASAGETAARQHAPLATIPPPCPLPTALPPPRTSFHPLPPSYCSPQRFAFDAVPPPQPHLASTVPNAPTAPAPAAVDAMQPFLMFMQQQQLQQQQHQQQQQQYQQQQQQQMAHFMTTMMANRDEERAERVAERAEAARTRQELAALERQLSQMRLEISAHQSAAGQHDVPSAAGSRPLVSSTPPASRFVIERSQSNLDSAYPSRAYVPLSASGAAPAAPAPVSVSAGPGSRSYQFEPHRRVADLPDFSGCAEQWPMFISMFRHSTTAYGYSHLENQSRLVKCLSGEARDAVTSVLIRPENVDAAIAILERKFGRPDILARSQLQSVRNLPVLDEKKLEQLEPFANKVQNMVTFLDHDDTRQYLNDPTILDELVAKLPPIRRMEWAGAILDLARIPNLLDFSAYMVTAAQKASLVSVPTASPVNQSQRHTGKGKHLMVSSLESRANTTRPCLLCSQRHRLADCEGFQQLNIDDRWEEARHRHLCYYCLIPGHGLETCRKKRTCGINSCVQLHHPLLHKDADEHARQLEKRAVSRTPIQPQSGGPSDHTAARAVIDAVPAEASEPVARIHTNPFAPSVQIVREEPDDLVLYRIIPVKVYGPNRVIETYAMMDDGAAVTVIDSQLAAELELDGPVRDLTMRWWGTHSATETVREVALGISGIEDYHQRHELHKVRAVNNFDLPTQSVNLESLHSRYRHLRKLPLAGYANAVPKILIGDDYHHLCVPLKLRMQSNLHGLAAVMTKLGWVVYGRDDQKQSPSVARIMHCRVEPMADRYAELERTVREFTTTESFGVMPPGAMLESDDDAYARSTLAATTKRIGDRFQTGLLWRPDTKPFPDSYKMALHRLHSVEAKMRRDPDYAKLYSDQIASYVTKGYARILSPVEIANHDARTWYLPHFGVKNPNKPGKFRLVFDAAATVNGVSLNSALMSGPDLNQPLTTILLKFRLGIVGICADVREMFHQVLIRPEDQNAQRFLWRHGDRNAPPDVYVMQAMTFGSTCSPTSAQYVKNLNASEFEIAQPAAANAIKCLHYVDDYVASFDSIDEAVEVTSNVIRIHQRGGFELRGFVSNSRDALTALGEIVDPGQSISLQPEKSSDKILGMCWKLDEDAFTFEVSFHHVSPTVMSGTKTPTKREILSAAMSVFDPFGLVADFVLPAKLMVQDLWKTGVGWDEAVPTDISRRWHAWREEVERLQTLRVPRCYSAHIRIADSVQLHVFADASEAAFAAVAYWRIVTGGQTEVAFISGKTKCAPLKILSIPRLELQAAVLATRLMITIKEIHGISINKTVMWTDSRTVEQWVKSDQRRFKPFVAHRVAEVLDGASASCWRWLPTVENVADDGTRVKSPLRFDTGSRWLRGPAFLRLAEAQWPQRTEPDEGDVGDTEEIRARFLGVTRFESTIDFTRFSQLNTLCRTVALMMRFARNALAKRKGEERQHTEPGPTEIEDAMMRLIRVVQIEGFSSEATGLLSGDAVCPSSSVFRLMPYMDAEEKIIRLNGRADGADSRYLSFDAKRPILLPRRHRFTELVARHHHQQMGHQLEDAIISSIRQRFWVPQLRRLVRSVKNGCPDCRIRAARPSPPVMGQLPADRMTPYVRPFSFTGLDYFGPVMVTVGRRHEKRWVALFTCLTVRAVHLELAADLSADACLLCVRNFANIRGVPRRIRSDNGTNFVGAWGEMQREPTFFDEAAMRRGLSNMGIEWRFNCPGNPEAGGAWERLVQSTKRVLAVTLKEVAPRVETLKGLLNEAANILNSRPLTHLPVEPSDPEPLTPNHFLLGGPNSTTTPGSMEATLPCARKQWRICQQLTHRFWERWVQDYLPELTRRSKHYKETAPLKDGDLVMVCDANTSRSQWRRGRVVSVVRGADGRVRTAEVRTADGTIRRPVTKLAVLDVSMSPD